MPVSALDYVGMVPHGLGLTHVDAVGHVYFEGVMYNGRLASDCVIAGRGLTFGAVAAQRGGIVTRGVLLDVAAARGVDWLVPGVFVTADDLAAAEQVCGVEVGTGDALLVRIGLGARERVEGPEDRSLRAGLDASAVEWLYEREVALYGGDCIERMPYPSAVMKAPLHQIGLVSMGLALLDAPLVEELSRACRELSRYEFMFTAAPLPIQGGTGSPVNPLAVF
ncbi:cyclase family protein [Yinghuangia seranimata]|uniref:cyclase family protein n=1 Tax=Yinghuangia seranimata TaxID=408067 RepID=UPI00248CD4FB|nr:cyclase family protein [Yinghuangia seranimata]MDI2129783.1 cyclase family protein [Yinghuangia seranimata]